MTGQSIEFAKETLKFCLLTLPENCLFNICSFGSDFCFIFEKLSVLRNQYNLDESFKEIKKFDASFGGTNIFDPLYNVF